MLGVYVNGITNHLNQNFESPNFQFSLSSHSIVVFIPIGISLLSQHLQFLLGVEVYTITRPWKPLHPTRTAEDVIATKGLQEWAQQLNGARVETENKSDSKFWFNWNLPNGAWNLIYKTLITNHIRGPRNYEFDNNRLCFKLFDNSRTLWNNGVGSKWWEFSECLILHIL